MKKDDVLRALIVKLEQVLAILRSDPESYWTSNFENALVKAKSLLATGYAEDELRELWSVITGPYYPKEGGFGDYSPGHRDPATGRWIPAPGADRWHELTKELSDLALELRVIGRY